MAAHSHAEELASYVGILAKSEHLPPRQRALALSGTGFGLFASGDQATAQPLLEQASLPLYRQAGDMLGAATTAAMLGHLLALQHQDWRGPSELLEQTLAPLQEAGKDDRLAGPERACTAPAGRGARVQFSSARSGSSQADHDRAAQLFTEGLNAARSAQGPVHHPRPRSARPGAQQPGTGRSDRRGGTPCRKGCRSRPRPGTNQASPTTWRRSPRGRHPAGPPGARRASARRRRRTPASQGHLLAARARAPRRPRRWSPGRAALRMERCSIRAGLDTGTVPWRQPRR